MLTPVLSPLNDFALGCRLATLDDTGRAVPLTEATVEAFLATSDAPDATVVGGLTATVTHLGGGRWLVAFDAEQLTPELLAQHFAAAVPYVIVQAPGSLRVAIRCAYRATRTATVFP